ncbi:MAG: iron uptake porin [Prochlorococcaceae cyanobacterium]
MAATDWAYQALANLEQRHGCVAGYPDGTWQGGSAISRYEAAALLAACLDRVTEVTDELKRLLQEFELELAVLKGRVDGLEARAAELEASQFSPTTQLRADARWVMGGLSYSGNTLNEPIYRDPRVPGYTPLPDAFTFNYDLRLNFDTSFSGRDLLRTTLRAGNFARSGFGAEPTPLTELAAGFQQSCGDGSGSGSGGRDCANELEINRLFYQVPLGGSVMLTLGARVRQDDLLPVWPSAYTDERILQIFQYAGAPGAYSQVLGGGAGIWWRQAGRATGLSFGGAYVAANADRAEPAEGGIATAGSAAAATLQLAYTGKNWNLTAAYSRNDSNVRFPGTPVTLEILPTTGTDTGYTNSFALSGYWQPFQSGWLPSISAGVGLNRIFYSGRNTLVSSEELGYRAASESWMVGLVWQDAFVAGNSLGLAFGQPMRAINTDGDTVCEAWFPPACLADGSKPSGDFHKQKDQNFAMELYYRMAISDRITITPALFWFSRPQGQYTLNYGPGTDNRGSLSSLGGLIQSTFRF